MKNHILKLKMFNLFTFLTAIFIFAFYTLNFPGSVNAQTPAATTDYRLPTTVSPTSPLYTDLLVHNLFHTFSCLGTGQSVIGQPCLTYQLSRNAQGMIQGVPVLSQVDTSGGVLGTTSNLIGLLYLHPPVRTSEYLASVGKGLGIVKEANAQVVGSGAAVLSPIITLWQVSRNISYIIMIIIFVVIGMMVMFRTKINPQTVITAQAALPGLVLGLVLITFSYFLAALVTDTAFLGVNLVGHYFSAAQSGSTAKVVQDISSDSVGTIFSKFVGAISQGDISSAMSNILNSLDRGVQDWIKLFGAVLAFQAGSSIGGPILAVGGTAICGVAPAVATGGIAAALGAIGGPICGLIGGTVGGVISGALLAVKAYADPAGTFAWVLYFIAIAVLIYTMLKLLLKLITTYLSIIFSTITAPFLFLAAALPGRQGLATDWILNMLANVLAFPAVFAVFYFVSYLLGPTSDAGAYFGITNQFMPTDTQTLPLLGGLNLSFIRVLLAFGALLATPSIPDIIQKSIGKVSQAGQLLGQEISGGMRSGQGYFGQTTGGVGKISGNIGQAADIWYGPPPPGTSIAGAVGKVPQVNLPGWLKPRPW